MAQGKNAYIRYKVLDRCFRDSRKRYYIEDLLDACNDELYNYDGSSVTERTIRDDIHFMQRQAGGGVPLVKKYDGHRAYYMYSDRNFSIMDLPMSQSEVEMLSDTIQMLSRFKGLPNHEWLNATLAQMKSTFNINHAKESYVSFSQNEDLKKQLKATENCILAECAVKDRVWGIGLSMKDPNRFEIDKWNGQNLLGYTLMMVRERL